MFLCKYLKSHPIRELLHLQSTMDCWHGQIRYWGLLWWLSTILSNLRSQHCFPEYSLEALFTSEGTNCITLFVLIEEINSNSGFLIERAIKNDFFFLSRTSYTVKQYIFFLPIMEVGPLFYSIAYRWMFLVNKQRCRWRTDNWRIVSLHLGILQGKKTSCNLECSYGVSASDWSEARFFVDGFVYSLT